MPANEIKRLRESGDLKGALDIALAEYNEEPDNRWTRLNLAWVLIDLLKLFASVESFENFKVALKKVLALKLPTDDISIYDSICWRIGILALKLSKSKEHMYKSLELFQCIKGISFARPSKSYSFLFASMHKCLKESSIYIEFADWWDFKHFLPENHKKKTFDSGQTILSIAEQAYINYYKHLTNPVPKNEDFSLDTLKLKSFRSRLIKLHKSNPEHESIPYMVAKCHFLLGDKNRSIKMILPYAKRDRKNIWIWKLLAQCKEEDETLSISFLCRALALDSPEVHKRNCRMMLVEKLCKREMYDEARTELEHLMESDIERRNGLSKNVKELLLETWYPKAKSLGTNDKLYKEYIYHAEDFLDGELGKHTVVVEFVNRKRKILHFVAPGPIAGFLKYGIFIESVSIGDVIDIRFKGGMKNGLNQALSIALTQEKSTVRGLFRSMRGILKRQTGILDGRIGNILIKEKMIRMHHLSEGMKLDVKAVRYFDRKKECFGWKAFVLNQNK